MVCRSAAGPPMYQKRLDHPINIFKLWTLIFISSKLAKAVNTGNKKNTINVVILKLGWGTYQNG